MTITSNISTTSEHARAINIPGTVPIDRWITNLTSVNMKGTHVSTRALHKLLASCPALENLCLRGMSAVTNTTCIIIGDANPHLITLDLGRCTNMDTFGLMFICEAIERRRTLSGSKGQPSALRELRLSGLKRASEWALQSIACTFPALEVLDLSYSNGLTDPCFERFVEWHPDAIILEPRVQLSARDIGLDPADRTVHNRRITRLRHLNVSHCLSLTDRTCTHLSHAVPELEILELAGIGAAIEDAGLIRLLKTTPLIRKLDLEDASRITDDVLLAITPIPLPPQRSATATPAIAININNGRPQPPQ